jgi:UDP-N-acetylmuramoylalanine--D-glutamate ligase
MSYISDLSAKRTLVVGAGETGKAIAKYLESLGVKYSLFDENSSATDEIQILRAIPEGRIFDLAIISPGWRKDHFIVENLKSMGIKLISELDFAWLIKQELNPEQKWLAVTGTNGKTTTVQMLESIFSSAGVSGIACGNIGIPVIEAVTSENNFEYLVLELSSFQIEWSELPEYCGVAILNIAEDHIDWHGSFSDYASAKMKLLTKAKLAVLNLSDPEIILRSAGWEGRKVFFGLQTPQAGEIGLVEELIIDRAFVNSPEAAEVITELSEVLPTVPHNISNAMAAAALALSIGIPHPVVKLGIVNFKLDKHRLENIYSADGIDWVNDSKATNPHAASAALLSHLSNIWIAGGLAKGAKMDALIARTSGRIKAAIIIGKDGDVIMQALAKIAPEIPIYRVGGAKSAAELMDLVVSKALSVATTGDTVLLAPACASMDQFSSYVERGNLFTDSVLRLVAK